MRTKIGQSNREEKQFVQEMLIKRRLFFSPFFSPTFFTFNRRQPERSLTALTKKTYNDNLESYILHQLLFTKRFRAFFLIGRKQPNPSQNFCYSYFLSFRASGSTKSVSKQLTQLIVELNSSLKQIIVTNHWRFLKYLVPYFVYFACLKYIVYLDCFSAPNLILEEFGVHLFF